MLKVVAKKVIPAMGLLAIVSSPVSFASENAENRVQCNANSSINQAYVKKVKRNAASVGALLSFNGTCNGDKVNADKIAQDIEPNAIMMKKLPKTIIAKR